MAAIGAVATLGTAIGNVGSFLGLVASGISLMSTITQKPKEVDFYTLRMEIGNNQDAAGNPPTVIFSDLSNTQIVGVFEGNSKEPKDQCRNLGGLDLYRGLKNAEAPIQSFRTNKGRNDTLAKTTFEQACGFISDNVGKIPNQNKCKESYSAKRSMSNKGETIDTVPWLEGPADFFTGKSDALSKFAGAPFITSDNKIWDSAKGAFTDVTPKTANKRSGLQARRNSIEGFKVAEKRGLASTVKGERCEDAADGAAPESPLPSC